MKPVSLLLISDTYPPVMGGSEIEAQRVSAEMIRRGHRVLVLTSGGSPMPTLRDWVDPAGVPVRILTRRTTGQTEGCSICAAGLHGHSGVSVATTRSSIF